MAYQRPVRNLCTTRRTGQIRSLNNLEWSHALLGYRDLLGSNMVTATYTTSLSKRDLVGAIRCVILENPWLLANIFTHDLKGSSHNCYWRYINEVNLNDVVEFRYINNNTRVKLYSSLVSNLVHRSFTWKGFNKRDELLWKVVVINDIELCFIFDNSLLDGKSGDIVQLSILKILRNLENVPSNQKELYLKTIGRSDLPALIPHINDPQIYLNYNYSIPYLLKTIILPKITDLLTPKKLKYSFFNPLIPNLKDPSNVPEKIIFDNDNDNDSLDPKLTIINLSTIETKNIINSCEDHNVSVTAFLNIVAIRAVNKVLKKRRLIYQSLIDSRNCISPSNSILNLNQKSSNILLGNFFSIIKCHYDEQKFNTISFWKHVLKNDRELKRKSLKKNIKKKSLTCLILSSSIYISNVYKYINKLVISKRDAIVTIANLDHDNRDLDLQFNKLSKFNIERMSFITGAALETILIQSITTTNTTNTNNSPVMTLYFQAGINSINFQQLNEITTEFKKTITDITNLGKHIVTEENKTLV